MLKSVPCTIMRGGTSKGLFFMEDDIPGPGPERDSFLLGVMGSPDLRQIDGLGGSVSTTSKVAIIGRPRGAGYDVEYTFAQVSVDKPVVDYKGNCGNISAAVGPFALESGLVAAEEGTTIVRVRNTNTDKVIHCHVATSRGRVEYEGGFSISGVPGTSSAIKLAFFRPGGAVTGKLLPTGRPADLLDVPGVGPVRVSIVDSTNPLVFVRARDVGMSGKELPDGIDGDAGLLSLLERIRGAAACALGLVSDPRESAEKSPAVPKMTVVAEPSGYVAVSGATVEEGQIDVLGRMMSMQKTHKTYALTGALCTASAAAIEGTVVRECLSGMADPAALRIGHPGGSIQAGVETGLGADGSTVIEWAYGYRTARMLMRGTAYYR